MEFVVPGPKITDSGHLFWILTSQKVDSSSNKKSHPADSSCGSEEPLVGGWGALLSRAYSASWSGLRVPWQSGGDFYAFAFAYLVGKSKSIEVRRKQARQA